MFATAAKLMLWGDPSVVASGLFVAGAKETIKHEQFDLYVDLTRQCWWNIEK